MFGPLSPINSFEYSVIYLRRVSVRFTSYKKNDKRTQNDICYEQNLCSKYILCSIILILNSWSFIYKLLSHSLTMYSHNRHYFLLSTTNSILRLEYSNSLPHPIIPLSCKMHTISFFTSYSNART